MRMMGSAVTMTVTALERKEKVCVIGHHNGSLYTQKQPEAAALKAILLYYSWRAHQEVVRLDIAMQSG